MTIHDVVITTLMVVVTLLNIGRWAQARSDREQSATDDAADVAGDLAGFQREHKGEHEVIWKELERLRRRYHDEIVSWQQQVNEQLARLDERGEARDAQMQQIWLRLDRRREPR